MLPAVRVPQIIIPREEYVEEEYDDDDPMDAEGYQESEMNEIEEDDMDTEMSLVDKFAGGFKKVSHMVDNL